MEILQTKKPIKSIIKVLFFIIFFPMIIIPLAGNIFWVQGWIWMLWAVIFALVNYSYLYYKNPELLMERLRVKKIDNQKNWDKYFLLVTRIIYLLWLIIMPLDSQRFHLSKPFPLNLEYLGLIFLLISFFVVMKAFIDNPFLSHAVRIQKEKNQQIITSGIYSFVRHPMYLGLLLTLIGSPLFLGSMYGLIIGILFSFAFAIRAIAEEKVLEKEFEDYLEYKKIVKYRLIPFIW